MAFPSVEEFRATLASAQLMDIAREFLLNDEVPFAFRTRPGHYATLKQRLSEGLGVDPANIFVVGSGKIGFSLNPETYFRGFSAASDIDVFVADRHWFDTLWLLLIAWHYPKWNQLADAEWDTTKKRMTGIYQGWMWPNDARALEAGGGQQQQLRELSTRWFDTFRGLGRYNEFARRRISGRLYRTTNHALLYQIHSLRVIREIVRPTT